MNKAIIFLLVSAIILFGCLNQKPISEGSELSVEVIVPQDIQGTLIATHNCQWEGSGNTITCQGTLYNSNAANEFSLVGDLYASAKNDDCISCHYQESIQSLKPKEQRPFSYSCTLLNKQATVVQLNFHYTNVGIGRVVNCPNAGGSPPGGN